TMESMRKANGGKLSGGEFQRQGQLHKNTQFRPRFHAGSFRRSGYRTAARMASATSHTSRSTITATRADLLPPGEIASNLGAKSCNNTTSRTPKPAGSIETKPSTTASAVTAVHKGSNAAKFALSIPIARRIDHRLAPLKNQPAAIVTQPRKRSLAGK